MSGPAPADDRQRTNEPARGDWQPAPGVGWQHGAMPTCPVRSKVAKETWETWFGALVRRPTGTATDLPNLRLAIKLWVICDSGKAKGAERSAYMRLADDLGISRKGNAGPPVEAAGHDRRELRGPRGPTRLPRDVAGRSPVGGARC